MNIYISYDYNDTPLDVILADNLEKANIAFLAMPNQSSRVEEIDPSEDLGIHGIAFLFTSVERDSYRGIGTTDKKFRVWKRGK